MFIVVTQDKKEETKEKEKDLTKTIKIKKINL